MADLVIDFLGTSATSPDTTLACISVLRPQGIAVFAGGVPADIPLRYMNVVRQELTIRGSFMYPRFVPARLLKMIASGMLDLTSITVTTFPFEQINEAVQHASTLSGLNYCGIVFPGNMKEILI